MSKKDTMKDIVDRIASETTANIIERLRDAGFIIVKEEEHLKLQSQLEQVQSAYDASLIALKETAVTGGDRARVTHHEVGFVSGLHSWDRVLDVEEMKWVFEHPDWPSVDPGGDMSKRLHQGYQGQGVSE